MGSRTKALVYHVSVSKGRSRLGGSSCHLGRRTGSGTHRGWWPRWLFSETAERGRKCSSSRSLPAEPLQMRPVIGLSGRATSLALPGSPTLPLSARPSGRTVWEEGMWWEPSWACGPESHLAGRCAGPRRKLVLSGQRGRLGATSGQVEGALEGRGRGCTGYLISLTCSLKASALRPPPDR